MTLVDSVAMHNFRHTGNDRGKIFRGSAVCRQASDKASLEA